MLIWISSTLHCTVLPQKHARECRLSVLSVWCVECWSEICTKQIVTLVLCKPARRPSVTVLAHFNCCRVCYLREQVESLTAVTVMFRWNMHQWLNPTWGRRFESCMVMQFFYICYSWIKSSDLISSPIRDWVMNTVTLAYCIRPHDSGMSG